MEIAAADDLTWRSELREELGECLRELGEALSSANAVDVDDVFRRFHTIKGTAGLCGVVEIERLAHAAELTLERVRTSGGELGKTLRHALSITSSVVERMLEAVAEGGETGPAPERLMASLEMLQRAPGGSGVYANIGTILEELGLVTGRQIEQARLVQLAGDRRRLGEILVDAGHLGAHELDHALDRQRQRSRPRRRRSMQLRIGDVELLLWVRAELRAVVRRLAQNRLEEAASRDFEWIEHLERIAGQLDAIELQPMPRPLQAVFDSLQRTVLPLAEQSSKLVELSFEGGATLVSEPVARAVSTTLVHALRNAVDHGVESPEQRERAGKPRAGQLKVKARSLDSGLVLTVEDDGRGIDLQGVTKRAVATGQLEESRASTLTDEERVELVFLAGLTTRDAVTRVSGMGVGMDAVRHAARAAGGEVALETEAGVGTKVVVSFPTSVVEGGAR